MNGMLIRYTELKATEDIQCALRVQRKETAHPVEESEKCFIEEAVFLLDFNRKITFFCYQFVL